MHGYSLFESLDFPSPGSSLMPRQQPMIVPDISRQLINDHKFKSTVRTDATTMSTMCVDAASRINETLNLHC